MYPIVLFMSFSERNSYCEIHRPSGDDPAVPACSYIADDRSPAAIEVGAGLPGTRGGTKGRVSAQALLTRTHRLLYVRGSRPPSQCDRPGALQRLAPLHPLVPALRPPPRSLRPSRSYLPLSHSTWLLHGAWPRTPVVGSLPRAEPPKPPTSACDAARLWSPLQRPQALHSFIQVQVGSAGGFARTHAHGARIPRDAGPQPRFHGALVLCRWCHYHRRRWAP